MNYLKYKKEDEQKESKKLATVGFALGVAVALDDKDCKFEDAVAGGVAGVLIAGLVECLFPKASSKIAQMI